MITAEVDIMKALDSPHIIKFYEYFETQDCYCILMEYCDEGTLILYNTGNLTSYI